MKIITIMLLSVFVTIVIVNIPPVKWMTDEDLVYSNANGTFTFEELNYASRNYELCIDNFRAFKSTNNSDTILYRLTQEKFYKVWLWGDYLFNEKYKLPYRSYREVDKIKEAVVNKTAWQDF